MKVWMKLRRYGESQVHHLENIVEKEGGFFLISASKVCENIPPREQKVLQYVTPSFTYLLNLVLEAT